ncbi:hypothetical protein [Peribacillus sp. JNUCC41]|uniref:hypothetical protein n=1 Tax=Peribacillus sp. JNUCC41 TaxID=2778370 RepID=UPI00177A81D8|nr:hypothetical protein [Brevibacillus sp. JNUCC-41]QOS92936.1 hypothetical protein JNUCC41_00095 [Brevibacillus sp. JNUCC-41]
MKFADHLSKSDIQKFNQLRRGSKQSKPETKPKKKEYISNQDWEFIMGMHRDTYKKVRGRVRGK